MPLEAFRARNFRCLEDVELEPDAKFNLIHGRNASGKTSLLEALAYLGRGRSFRGAPAGALIRHGEQEFVLNGKVRRGGHATAVGVRNGRAGLEVRIDSAPGAGAASLAELLPLQVIDPDVHELVAGGPDGRRRYLDWLAFHVKHDFLGNWRRFRRALKQRNAALKGPAEDLDAWSAELVEYGLKVDAARRSALDMAVECLEEHATALLGAAVRFEYTPGWGQGLELAAALADGVERDRQQGSTQAGPHRADLRLIVEERQARRLVSRGQQKLLACSLILGATEAAQAQLERPMLLLLDDPVAELDAEALQRLTGRVFALGSQVVATALEPEALSFPGRPAVFHVEHGRLSRQA